MPANDATQAPIYHTLVQEQGDVVATARETAEEIKQTAEDVLDFSTPTRVGAPAGPAS
ncbi:MULTISPECIES: hypothetical protein [Streptomyces]|uniref:hypothetical protein n=1 Tax=Streptomyces TaxID=1883 RepID=UPI000A7E7C69|nr:MULTISPECIES: hypothetical protein [Streptomyces]MCF3120395.1 hypothetical protein [Streptomyces arenae]